MSKTDSKCPDCGGTGVVILLTSQRPCHTCAARSQSVAAKSAAPGGESDKCAPEPQENSDGLTVVTRYDSLGRVVRKTFPVPPASIAPVPLRLAERFRRFINRRAAIGRTDVVASV